MRSPASISMAFSDAWGESIAPLVQGWIAQEQARERYRKRFQDYLQQDLEALRFRAAQVPAKKDEGPPRPAKLNELKRLLRRLSGLTGYPDPRAPAQNEWSGSKAGLVGMRTCRHAQWDNAIRALEEDR